MPRVKVLNQLTGKWSDYVYGIDKSYFIKSLLLPCFYRSPFCRNPIDLRTGVTLSDDINMPIEGIELDFEPVRYKDIIAVLYFGPNMEEVDDQAAADWMDYQPNLENFNVDNVRTVMVSKSLMELLIRESSLDYLVPAWEMILEMASIPENADASYPLILRFTK